MKAKTLPIIAEIKQKALPLLQRYGVKRAGVFGSVVRGETHRSSDIDLLVELDPSISLLGFARINRELEEALGHKVDLVEYDAIRPLLRERVLQEEVRIL